MSKAEQAVDLFDQGYNCAQAVLAAFGPREGLTREDCLRLACGLGAGMGRMAETCGAVTGAFLVLSLRHSGPAVPDPQARGAVYDEVRDFVARFRARNGSIVCRELLGCDISTPEGLQQAKEQELHVNICRKLVRDAAELLEQV